MLDRTRFFFLVSLAVAVALAGCGGGDRRGGIILPDGGGGEAGPRPDGAIDAGGGDTDAGFDAGSTTRDAGLEFADGGGEPCLTFTSASSICGFDSDDRVCAFSVSCGTSTDDGQCKINCEMGTTVRCYGPEDVGCLLSAVDAEDCTALSACGWIL